MKEILANGLFIVTLIGVVWFLVHVYLRERRIEREARKRIDEINRIDWDIARREMERKFEARVRKEIQAIRDGKLL